MLYECSGVERTPLMPSCCPLSLLAVQVPEINVEHLKRHVLANVGLLLAVLVSGGQELLQVSMVTQVTPSADGQLIRSIFNPLE